MTNMKFLFVALACVAMTGGSAIAQAPERT